MEQAHPTGCVNCLKSELRFERDKNRFQKGSPMGREIPPPPPQVTSQSIQYLRLHQSTCTCGGGGGVGNMEGLKGQSIILGLANQKVCQNTFK
jgi:hypothetical protein